MRAVNSSTINFKKNSQFFETDHNICTERYVLLHVFVWTVGFFSSKKYISVCYTWKLNPTLKSLHTKTEKCLRMLAILNVHFCFVDVSVRNLSPDLFT